jgi:hypothetical protein
MATSTVVQKGSSTSPLKEKTPSPTRRNLVETFDMTVDDATMPVDDATMAMEEELAKHLGIADSKAGKRKMRLYKKSTDMLQAIRGSSSSAAAADVIEDLDLSEVFPMQVNKEGDQQKRQANTPPSSNKKQNKRAKAKSDLLEIGDNPEEAHEPKGLPGRPAGSAKSSSSSSAAAAAPAPAAVKQVGVQKDTNTNKSYWKKQNITYIYQQLELDGMRFTNIQKVGKEDVQDHVLGKKVKKTGKKLTKAELLEMLYKSRKI